MPFFPDQLDTQEIYEDQTTVSGGYVDQTEEHLLHPTQVAHLLNVRLDIIGKAEKRRGVLPRGIASSAFPHSLAELRDDLSGTNLLLAHYGSALFSNAGANVFSPRATTVSLYDTPYMAVQGRANNLATLFWATAVPYVSNTSLPQGNLIALDRGFGVTEVATIRPRSVLWFQARLWAFNSAMTNHGPDFLLWSGINDGRDFSNGQSVQIDRDSGDLGSALSSVRGTDPRLILYKERSVHELLPFWQTDGYFPATANALDFTRSFLRPLVLGTGCIATRSLVTIAGVQGQDSDQLFFSAEGIRSLARSITDAAKAPGLPLSYPIDQTIQRINFAPSAAGKIAAFYWNQVAYFAVPVDGALENNLVIAYDTAKNAWWQSDWDVAAWSSARLDAARRFFFLSSATGVTETYNSGSGYTAGSHLYETDTGTLDPGRRPIELDIQTRAFTFGGGDPGVGLKFQKRAAWVDLAVQASSTAVSLLAQFKADDDPDWSDLSNIYIDPVNEYPFLPEPLPISFAGTKLHRARLSLHAIPPFYRLQLRFRDTTSFAQLKIHQLSLTAYPTNIRLAR